MSASSSQSDDSDTGDLPESNEFSGFRRSLRIDYSAVNQFSDDDFVQDDYDLTPGIPNEMMYVTELFDKRQKSDVFKAFDEKMNFEKEVVEQQPFIYEGATVLMSAIASLLPAKSQIRKFIHTWQDLSIINSVEATRSIGSFFVSQYNKFGKWNEKQNRGNPIEICWSAGSRPYTSPNGSQGLRVVHYIGLGFPPPSDGMICLKGNGFSPNDWVKFNDIKRGIQSSVHFILDCDKAASLAAYMKGEKHYMQQRVTAMFSCGKNDTLHIPETIPQNIFSCILLDPIASVRHLMPHMSEISDRMLTMVIDLFTDTIAKDMIDPQTYATLFHSSQLASSLWKHFILAQRLMKQFGIVVHSLPELPDCSVHPLWQQFDYSLRCNGDVQLNVFMDLYNNHFLSHDIVPSKTVCAFISSLVKNDDVYEKVIQSISTFMLRSPYNCSLIVPFLEPKYIGSRRITQERSIDGARAWNIVISGMLLVNPGNAKSIASDIVGTTVMALVRSSETDDVIRKFLISAIIALSDAQTHIIGFLGNEDNIVGYFPLIFAPQTSPETRMMFAVLMRTILSRSQSKPSSTGPTGIHVIAEMLLKEDSAIIRALAVSILAFLMFSKSKEFNRSILNIALPAAIDGSYRVRRVFVTMLHRYIDFGGSIKSDSPLSVPDILAGKVKDTEGVLSEITDLLASDPSDVVRDEAVEIQPERGDEEDDEISTEKLKQVSDEIQRTAHASLFTHSAKTEKLRQRYTDNTINSGGLELFEILPSKEDIGAITSIAFDRDHSSAVYGSINGTVVWGDDKWSACSSAVTDVHHMGGSCVAIGSSSGYVYILKRGHQKPVDCFHPCFSRSGTKTLIAGSNKTNDAFICTGGNEVVQWDLASLKPISYTALSSPLVCCARNDNEYVASLCDGSVVEYDVRSMEVIRTITTIKGKEPIRVGFHCDKLYCAAESGPFTFYEEDRIVSTSETWNRATDVILHPTIDAGIIVGDEISLVDSMSHKLATMNTSSRGQCCCFDGERPLAAIGNDNGTVAIWRIPN